MSRVCELQSLEKAVYVDNEFPNLSVHCERTIATVIKNELCNCGSRTVPSMPQSRNLYSSRSLLLSNIIFISLSIVLNFRVMVSVGQELNSTLSLLKPSKSISCQSAGSSTMLRKSETSSFIN